MGWKVKRLQRQLKEGDVVVKANEVVDVPAILGKALTATDRWERVRDEGRSVSAEELTVIAKDAI